MIDIVVVLKLGTDELFCSRAYERAGEFVQDFTDARDGRLKRAEVRLGDYSLKKQLKNKDFEIPVFNTYDFTIKNSDSKYSRASIDWVGKAVECWVFYPATQETKTLFSGRVAKTKSDFANINITVEDSRKYVLNGNADDWYFFGDNNIRKVYDTRDTSKPAVRRGYTLTAFNGKLYCIGGGYVNQDGSARIKEAATYYDIWESETGKAFGEARNINIGTVDNPQIHRLSYHTCTVYNGQLWLIGGYRWYWNGSRRTYEKRVRLYTYASSDGRDWGDRTRFKIPIYEHQAVVHKGRLFVMGGRGRDGRVLHGFNNTVFRYDDISREWERIVSDFSPVADHQCVVFQGRIWSIGGVTETAQRTNEVRSSSNGHKWRRELPLPNTRGGHTCVVLGEKIWCIGGRGNYRDKNTILSYDGSHAGWREDELPNFQNTILSGREYVAATFQNRIFVTRGAWGYDKYIGDVGNIERPISEIWAMCDGGDSHEDIGSYINARFLKGLTSKIQGTSLSVGAVSFDITGDKTEADVLKQITQRLFLYFVEDGKGNYLLRPIYYKSAGVRTLKPNIRFSVERNSELFYTDYIFGFRDNSRYIVGKSAEIKRNFGFDLKKSYNATGDNATYFSYRGGGKASCDEFIKRYSSRRIIIALETTDDISDLLLYDTVNVQGTVAGFSYGENRAFTGRIMKIDYTKSALEVECLED